MSQHSVHTLLSWLKNALTCLMKLLRQPWKLKLGLFINLSKLLMFSHFNISALREMRSSLSELNWRIIRNCDPWKKINVSCSENWIQIGDEYLFKLWLSRSKYISQHYFAFVCLNTKFQQKYRPHCVFRSLSWRFVCFSNYLNWVE